MYLIRGGRQGVQIKEKMIGNRIEIRDYRAEDREFVEKLWFDSNVNQFISDPSREYADDRYYDALSHMEDNGAGYYLIIQMKDNGERMGTCCMFPDTGKTGYDIGYTIAVKYWKMGYGTEAVELLLHWIKGQGGKTVTCEVAVDNAASNALVRKMGFSVYKDAEFKKWNMNIMFKSHIYRKDLLPQQE